MIRSANVNDLTELARVYDTARQYMREKGNMNQWVNGYPSAADLTRDIDRGELYAMTDEEGRIYGAFALVPGEDPTYDYIEGGWRSDAPYATIHRIGSDGTHRRVLEEAVTYARQTYDHLRADTHADNMPMQHCLVKCGFEYRGVIYLANGDPRMAYDWIREA